MIYPKFEPDTFYHIYNHAVGSEKLFRNKENYYYFLKKFTYYTQDICQTYAYCLMPNHFHFLVRFADADSIWKLFCEKKKIPIEQEATSPLQFNFHLFVMRYWSNLMNGYAQAYNKRFDRKGALFMDYLKRKVVIEESYFSKLVHYIHYNPIHHGFCKKLEDWQFSSYFSMLSDKSTLLKRETVLGWFGSREAFVKFHQQEPEIHLSD